MKHVPIAIAATIAFALAAGFVNSGASQKSARGPSKASATDVAPASPDRPENDAQEQIFVSAITAPEGAEESRTKSNETGLLPADSEIRDEASASPGKATDTALPSIPDLKESVNAGLPDQAAPSANRRNSPTHWKHFAARQHPRVHLAETARERPAYDPSERRFGFSGHFGACYYSGYVTAAGYQIRKSC
ncbi:hypothetical protein [Methylocapsa palsarum]|uniref:Lectin-like protein BA14k n=1 Tax=Methylocapsa palsarum TaxID=1612308 RepID=A0A1I3Y5T6_9HYPH|nr:hypothetical protein [Methylocapsa palsarum]SFK27337.1 hypothetical protein SAMN05444581_10535 [Methylocapsa palsarum]